MIPLILFLFGLSELVGHLFGSTWLELLARPLTGAFPGCLPLQVFLSNPLLASLLMLPLLGSQDAVRWVRIHVLSPLVLYSAARRFRIQAKPLSVAAVLVGLVGFQIFTAALFSANPLSYQSSTGPYLMLLGLFGFRFLANNLPREEEIQRADPATHGTGVAAEEGGIVTQAPSCFTLRHGRLLGDRSRVEVERLFYKEPQEETQTYERGAVLASDLRTDLALGTIALKLRAAARVTRTPQNIDLDEATLANGAPDRATFLGQVERITRTLLSARLQADSGFQKFEEQVEALFSHQAGVEWSPEEVEHRIRGVNEVRLGMERLKTTTRNLLAIHSDRETFQFAGGLFVVDFACDEIGILPELDAQLRQNRTDLQRVLEKLSQDRRQDMEAVGKLLTACSELDLPVCRLEQAFDYAFTGALQRGSATGASTLPGAPSLPGDEYWSRYSAASLPEETTVATATIWGR